MAYPHIALNDVLYSEHQFSADGPVAMSEPVAAASSPGAAPQPQPEEAPPRRKRIKIDIACDTCRSRKVRCDGVRPSCGTCSRKFSLRNKCTYSGDVQHERAHLPSLSASIRRTDEPLESRSAAGHNPASSGLQRMRPPLLTAAPDKASPGGGIYSSSAAPAGPSAKPSHPVQQVSPPGLGLPPAAPTPASTIRSTHSDERRGGHPDTSPSAIDSMTAVTDEGTNTFEYFGSSSAGSFTRQIKAAIDARLGVSAATPAQPTPTLAGNGPQDALDGASYTLPARRVADRLMSMYWLYVDPLYPFLNRKVWERSYRALFEGTPLHTDERIFVTMLNVIFALSTQLLESTHSEYRENSSTAYFVNARDLLRLDPWEPGSLELVQCLLLMGQYSQSTNNPHKTWMVVGNAIRIAQGLGLHLPETSANVADADERETLRRVWYGCVLMDRMVCMTHGRPAMVSENVTSTVPMPVWIQPGSVRAATDAAISSKASQMYFAFFVKSVELYEIIHQAILKLYSGAEARSARKQSPHASHSEADDEDLGIVMQIDSSLSRWKCSLPDHLKPDTTDLPDSATFQRQAVILRIRFLHARILLLRPIMARFCLDHAPYHHVYDSLKTRVTQQCALFCVETAKRMISTLIQYQQNDGTVGLLPAWWYRVYYVYSAATILIAAKMRPDVFPTPDISRSWEQAMSILETHERFGQSAKRCAAALHILSTKILQDTQAPSETLGAGVSVAGRTEVFQTLADSGMAISGQMDENPFFGGSDLAGISIDINGFTWLNDMHAWELLNQA